MTGKIENKLENYFIRPIGIVKSTYKEASLTYQDQDLELDEEILTKTKTGKESISELIIKEE